jgi:ribonucleoside-diphosphate reductase alpha chain
VALQHGIPAEALAKSVGRLPVGTVAPEDLDGASERRVPASPIGAALDLVAQWEAGITLA